MISLEETLHVAVQHHRAGNLPMAEQLYRQILQADPHHVDAWHFLGVVTSEGGRQDTAIECLARAISLNPTFGLLHNTLGKIYRTLARWPEAIAAFQEAVRLQPGVAEVHSNLGSCLLEAGRIDEAEAAVHRALELDPNLVEAQGNMGSVLVRQKRFSQGTTWLRRAVANAPTNADAHCVLGLCLAEQGLFDEALASYQEAVRLKPNLADAHMYRAIIWLLKGDFARGWPEYEWRWKSMGVQEFHDGKPVWDGTPLPGRTLLLTPEQGLGDILQFVRYARLVRPRVGRLMIGCHRPVARLLRECDAIDQVIPFGESAPEFDYFAPLLSLPRIVGTTLDTIPAEVPYLRAPAVELEIWRARLTGRFKVGICWQGNRQHHRDHVRSIPLAQFAPLAQPGVQLYSLQVGDGREQFDGRLPVIDLSDELRDFADTAAVVSNLDLIVTCDTAVAHLAGGLGKPVWLVLPLSSDWRWMLEREDSPWYPTMRLFRQPQVGDWSGVFEQIARELAVTFFSGP